MTWYRAGGQEDRQVIPSASSGITFLSSEGGLRNILRFKNVRDADLGVYTCRAENELGRAEAAMELSGIAVAAVLRVAPPRDGMNRLTSGEDPDGQFVGNLKGQPRVVYHLIWDVMSHSPIYEYRLWLRPVNSPPATWINLIIPTTSSSTGSLLGSSSSFLHSHQYMLSDLKPGVVYLVSVQSRNRFGWSAESNVLHLTGDPEVLDYHDEQQGPTTAPTVRFTSRKTAATTLSAVQVIDSVSVQQRGTHEESGNKKSPTSSHQHHHHQHRTTTTASHGVTSPPLASPSSHSSSPSIPPSLVFLILVALFALNFY